LTETELLNSEAEKILTTSTALNDTGTSAASASAADAASEYYAVANVSAAADDVTVDTLDKIWNESSADASVAATAVSAGAAASVVSTGNNSRSTAARLLHDTSNYAYVGADVSDNSCRF